MSRPHVARKSQRDGYVLVKIDGEWLREDRYQAARMIGRPLLKIDRVYHIDGVVANSDQGNLIPVRRGCTLYAYCTIAGCTKERDETGYCERHLYWRVMTKGRRTG